MEKSSDQKTTTSSPAAGETGGGVAGGGGARYKGVRKRKWGKWVAEIRLPNSRERIWLGSHDSAEKAARAFDAALFCLRGGGAGFNFPDSPPDIPGAASLTRHEIQLAAARYASEAAPGPEGPTPTSSAEGDVSDQVDWSFLDRLDSNNEAVSDFGLGSGLQYDVMMMDHRDLYPASPVGAHADYDVIGNGDDENGGEAYPHQHSFLWNF